VLRLQQPRTCTGTIPLIASLAHIRSCSPGRPSRWRMTAHIRPFSLVTDPSRAFGLINARRSNHSTNIEQASRILDLKLDMSSAKAFTFLPLGAIIQKFTVNGKNIVQGFPTAELYKKYNAPYFGETIGRIANRVSDAKINSLNGKSYSLAANNAPNSLHGGVDGWGKREFEGPSSVERNGKEAIFFKYVSVDGEEGYPGTVEFRVWYVQETESVDGTQQEVLNIEYEAELVGDEVDETAISVTNHR
jgi:galactose mutarotase-like enzyme